MRVRWRLAAAGAARAAAIVAAVLIALFTTPAAAGPSDREFPLDVDLGDRVDPVRPGEEIVYELEVENFTAQDAPGVVVTEHLPPGTTFVVAHREPDWLPVSATVDGSEVRFALGAVPPCDQTGTARCRDLWVVLRVDPDVPEGTALTNRASVASSDPSLPANEATTVTTVSSAAIRSARLDVGRPGRDRIQVYADFARGGLRTPLEPPTATVDPTAGLTIRLGPPGGAPLVDLSIPGEAIECSHAENPLRRVRCRLRDRRLWKPLGVTKLDVILPGYLAAQRNNASLRLKLARQDVPADVSPVLELLVVADGRTYRDRVELAPSRGGRSLEFRKAQGEP